MLLFSAHKIFWAEAVRRKNWEFKNQSINQLILIPKLVGIGYMNFLVSISLYQGPHCQQKITGGNDISPGYYLSGLLFHFSNDHLPVPISHMHFSFRHSYIKTYSKAFALS